MQIPLNQSLPKRPPLELLSIKLYSTGVKGKVFTNRFYKSMNHNFGVEISLRNNTNQQQVIQIGGCVYNYTGKTIFDWRQTKNINPHSKALYDFFVEEIAFTRMEEGEYKVQFWVNGKKVQKEFFTVTYK